MDDWYRVISTINQGEKKRWDAPLSERNRADAYTGILDSFVYQLFVFPVEVVMTVYVQVEWSCGQDSTSRCRGYIKLTWLEI